MRAAAEIQKRLTPSMEGHAALFSTAAGILAQLTTNDNPQCRAVLNPTTEYSPSHGGSQCRSLIATSAAGATTTSVDGSSKDRHCTARGGRPQAKRKKATWSSLALPVGAMSNHLRIVANAPPASAPHQPYGNTTVVLGDLPGPPTCTT